MTARPGVVCAALAAAVLLFAPAATQAQQAFPPSWSAGDIAAYSYANGRVWNCYADIPESLDKEAESHSYRLRFAFALNQSLQLHGDMDVYQGSGDTPFARYPLTGRAYHGYRNVPAVLIEFAQPAHGDDFPDWADWSGFRILSDLRAKDDGTFYLAAQIDRRSDDATWVNLTQCYSE